MPSSGNALHIENRREADSPRVGKMCCAGPKKAEAPPSISGKVGFRAKAIIRNKEGHDTAIKDSSLRYGDSVFMHLTVELPTT